MNKRIILDKDFLYQKNIIEGISQKTIAKELNVSVDVVSKNLKEFSIKRKQGEWAINKEIVLTNEEIDIIYGCLLGDGCLTKNGKDKQNAQFTYTNKSKERVEFVYNKLNRFMNPIESYSYLDKRTNKIYERYTVRSQLNTTFTKLRNLWYLDEKIIPKNIILNPTICYNWYIDDGSLLKSKRSQAIKLSTHCFSKKDLEEIILPQLIEFSPILYKAEKNKEQYFIYISRNKIKDFLNFIGENTINYYNYKWDYKEYLNTPPKEHKDKEKIFCEMYVKGQTYYSIAKQFNIEPNVVKYYLIKNNLYKKGGVQHNV